MKKFFKIIKDREVILVIVFSVWGCSFSIAFIAQGYNVKSISCNVFFTILFGIIGYAIVKWSESIKNRSILNSHQVASIKIKESPEEFIEWFRGLGDNLITFNTEVKNWIELLKAAVDKIPERGNWYATYILPLESWENFARCKEGYNKALTKRNDIKKVRFIVQPSKIIKKCEVINSDVMKDTIRAEIEPKIVKTEEIDVYLRKENPEEMKDFAMFNNEFVISAKEIPRNIELKLDSVVSILLAKKVYLDEYNRIIEKLRDSKIFNSCKKRGIEYTYDGNSVVKKEMKKRKWIKRKKKY